jgi:hypothetical protein
MSDLKEGRRVLFVKDLTPGRRKYDAKLVRAELSRGPERLPNGARLWIRSETGYLRREPWAIAILEELPPYVPGEPWQDLFAALKQFQ